MASIAQSGKRQKILEALKTQLQQVLSQNGNQLEIAMAIAILNHTGKERNADQIDFIHNGAYTTFVQSVLPYIRRRARNRRLERAVVADLLEWLVSSVTQRDKE